MKKVVKDILNKKDLDKNLPVYAEYMCTLYYRFARLRLAMNYYTFFEVLDDTENKEEIKELSDRLNQIIKDGILSDGDRDKFTKDIDDIRKNVIKTMQVLTSYADAFDRYEYVINRVEYNFKDGELPAKYDDGQFTRKIMQYIVADEDSVVINSRISEVIGELPMRMTKQKFFERLNDGLNVYSETDEKSFEDFLYMVRSSAMLDSVADDDDTFENLQSIYVSLKNADYDNIDEKEYNRLRDMITYAAGYIEDRVNIYMLMQQVINDVYAMLCTSPYVKEQGDEEAACKSIIAYINDTFSNGGEAYDEKIENDFISIEGKQEKIHGDYMSYEHVLDELKTTLSEKDVEQSLIDCYNMMYKVQILVSDSLFVEFDGNTLNDKDMTKDYFEKRKNDFMSEVKTFFDNHGRTVNRAVMSAIIASLPVFFNNLQELQDYIYNSLESCRKESEKIACIEIINSFIEEITD